ncbi:hypothetical protein [Pseudoalteromonas ruthenica]|uniref:Uncharacterized protein n=1 Tax=Pseudoalteromonas ruthenica TaxID=151081 RepID=A0A0F4PU69_9GAMM|nr:hypothetical protein [Pseudoalteromonas ruthenica]KJY94993.1 hypothetical protein TW76_16160 [Pseudoalteromonas ruthenica]KJY98674.1 hypothetical protein TW72_13205 [Pseudoalteromonas ruthenica]TMO86967.1 hypothetical protein CWC12_11985 [Pseudoalteromonas ruthenica]TMO93773.1 hypothetical protein CWC13_05825 [Pseudoalteromonas ruthenica]TMO97477.1 hypothetical protein CWC07_13420 [Pseudoalteromonas ruthenica]
MKFNKALLSLAVAGALATPLAANAAAKIVVNDAKVGLPADTAAPASITYPVALNASNVSYGIKPNSYIASDDVSVDQVYVLDDGNSVVGQRAITFKGDMPASGRKSVSIAYSSDVQLPDEGTLRFQLSGPAGGFSPATANSLVVLAQVVDTAGFAPIAATATVGAATVGTIAYGTAVATLNTKADGSGLALPSNTDLAAAFTGASTGHFVEVGQSFDYADEDTDGDVDYVTIQLDTVSAPVAAGTNLNLALDGYEPVYAGATGVEWIQIDDGADNTAGTADDVWRASYVSAPATPIVDTNGAPVGAYSNDVGVLEEGEALPRRTQLYLAKPTTADYAPVDFVVTEGSKIGDKIDISIPEAKNTAGVDITAALADATTAVTITSGLMVDVDHATSQIDVEAEAGSRLQFVDEAVDTDLEASIAGFDLENGADYGITLNAGDSWNLTLKRKDGENSEAVESITFNGVALTDNGDGSWTTGDVEFLNAADPLLSGANLVINVDGETILYPNVEDAVDWMAELTVTDDGADGSEVTSGTYNVPVGDNADGKTHTWTINGLQAKIPYLYNINADDWSSVVKIVNESANEANVSAKVILGELGNKASAVLESGDYQTAVDAATGRLEGGYTFDIESLGHVPAEGHLTFDGKHIIESLGLDAATNYHIEIELLVEAAQNKVHVAAQNKNPNGRADSPVLYFINQTQETECRKFSTETDGGVANVNDVVTTCGTYTIDGRQWQ